MAVGTVVGSAVAATVEGPVVNSTMAATDAVGSILVDSSHATSKDGDSEEGDSGDGDSEKGASEDGDSEDGDSEDGASEDGDSKVDASEDGGSDAVVSVEAVSSIGGAIGSAIVGDA